MRLAHLFAITSIFAFGPTRGLADVTVSIEPGPGADFAEEFGLNLGELESQIASEIEEVFNVIEPGEFLQSFVNAEAFSARGLGVDSASKPHNRL